MRVFTFTVVGGTRKCNAHCPFCVSKQTGFCELSKCSMLNTQNLKKAALFALKGEASTVLFSGKGELTLYPEHITEGLQLLEPYGFSFFDLQTNGLEIGWDAAGDRRRAKHINEEVLSRWKALGLDVIALSTVGIDPVLNAKVYHRDYPDLAQTIAYARSFGYTVRLCIMMQRGGVDSIEKLKETIAFCREHGAEQLTIRPIRKPRDKSCDDEASKYVDEFGLEDEAVEAISSWVRETGELLPIEFAHDAHAYDIGGQNVCVSDCLTRGEVGVIRTLIFYRTGRTTYSWDQEGAVLLSGWPDGMERSELMF
ncbi:MAG: radical SAM protein [Candidatus Uhrbacteria bacterium]